MKTSARFLAMLLAVLMIAGAALTVSAFPDVEAGYKYGEAINVLSQLNVLGGFEDGSFKPEENVTRAQMAKLAYVLYTTFVDAGTGSVKFDDVAANHWANGYISWCYNKEVIGGFGDGTYAPEAPVTYDQALKIVCGVLGYTEWDSKLWPTDVRQVALRQLALGKNLEDVKGTDELTRGQVAQIMYNALKAPMKEKNIRYEDAAIGGVAVKIPVEVQMTLAADVWGFTETTYTVAGTKNYSIADIEDNTTTTDYVETQTFVKADSDESVLLYNASANNKANADKPADKRIAIQDTVELKDLGLEAYEDNTDALIGLDIVTITKDGELLGSASVKGYYKDGVEVAVSADGKTLTVDGQKFTAADIADIELYEYDEDNDALTSKAIFDASTKKVVDDKTAAAEAKLGLYTSDKNGATLFDAPYFARAFDFDGDAKVDGFMVLPLYAYEVTLVDEKDVDADNKDVPYIEYATVAEAAKDEPSVEEFFVADITAALAEGDVFVGVELAGKLIVVEVIKPVEAYATSISATKITINGTSYSIEKDSIAGAMDVSGLDHNVLGEDAKTSYWFYNGVVIKSDKVEPADAYSFGILAYVKKDEGENVSDLISSETYTATLIVDGKEVKLPVATIDGADLKDDNNDGYADNYAPGKYEANDKTPDFAEETVTKYDYKFVTEMKENDKGEYDLKVESEIGELSDVYEVVAKDGVFKYHETTKLYSLGGDDKHQSSIILDDNSIIYYTYKDEADKTNGTFDYVGSYNKANIPTAKLDNNTLAAKAYLKKTDDGMYVLLAAFLAGELKLADDNSKPWEKDGSLFLYATESQNTVLGADGKKYYSYTFLDNATLTPADAITSTVTTDKKEGNNVEAGKLYYALANGKGYQAITKSDATGDDFASINCGVIDKVAKDLGYVFINNNAVVVDDSVKIWGLTAVDEAKQFTLAELNTMFNKLADDQKLRAIELVTKTEDKETTIAIIIEVFEDTDDDSTLESVYGDLHEQFIPTEE